MDAIGYASLSDRIEADVNFSFDAQDDLIRRTTNDRNWTLLEIMRDANVGDVATLKDRIGLATAFAAIRDGRAQTIVVARLDRLAIDLVLQEQILADARRIGAHVCSATASDETDRIEERAVIRATLAATKGYESAMRDLSVRYRMMRSPVSGDREHAALSRIEELTEHGASVEDIAATLNGEGFSPHFSRIWNRPGLQRIVERMRARRA